MINSKDATILIIGLVLSIIITIASSYRIILDKISTIYVLIFILFIIVGITTWILYARIREAETELEKESNEQKRLEEKLKIHEQLIDMKAEIKELQKKVYKK